MKDADSGTADLEIASADFKAHLQMQARAYPNVTAIAAIVNGEVCSPQVVARSDEYIHFSPVALDRAQALTKMIALMPDNLLLAAFEGVMRYEKEVAAIKARIKAILGEVD